jgi:hypothetical protein
MSEITVVLYDPPNAMVDVLRDKSYFVTTSYGNAIEQCDAAYRREIMLKAELELLTGRYSSSLDREESLRQEIDALRNQLSTSLQVTA